MRKAAHTLLVSAAGVSVFFLGSTNAGATVKYDEFTTWTRSCGTTYGGSVKAGEAVTGKGNNGHCKGHAWVRVHYKNGNWSGWKHHPTNAVIKSTGDNIRAAEHKGCEKCEVHFTRV